MTQNGRDLLWLGIGLLAAVQTGLLFWIVWRLQRVLRSAEVALDGVRQTVGRIARIAGLAEQGAMRVSAFFGGVRKAFGLAGTGPGGREVNGD